MFAAEPSGFEVWWSQFINVAYPSLQMFFWLAMVVLATIAVVTFKRWVDAQVSADDTKSDAGKSDGKDAQEISVEEFVE